MFIMQVVASQLHFLANRNAELAILPLFWPVNCIKIGGRVVLLSCPSIYFLFYSPAEILARTEISPLICVYNYSANTVGDG